MSILADGALWKAWRKGQIEEGGNSPDGWIRVSKNLIEGAGLVHAAYLAASEIILRAVSSGGPLANERTPEEDRAVKKGLQTHTVGLMLFGFAIECLLKASYLRRGGTLYVDGRLRHPKRLAKTHNLAELAQVLGCSSLFTDEQMDVLDLLSARNEMGRYPVHTRYDAYGLQPVLNSEGCVRFYGIWDARKSAKICGVLATLYKELGEDCPEAARCLVEELKIECAAYKTPMPDEFLGY